MNFFEQIAALDLQGDLNIVINTMDKDNLKISIHLKNKDAGSKANALIPLTMSGKPGEIDGSFFTSISGPLKETSGLLVNLAAYQKAQDELKKQSSGSKPKGEEKKQPNDKDKKYEDAMKAVEDLEAQGKFREAYAKVPQPAAFPEHEAELTEKKGELLKRFAADMFAA